MNRNGINSLQPRLWMADGLSCVIFVAWVLLPKEARFADWLFWTFLVWTVFRLNQQAQEAASPVLGGQR